MAVITREAVEDLRKSAQIIEVIPSELRKCIANCREVAEETGSIQLNNHLDDLEEKLKTFDGQTEQMVDSLRQGAERYDKLSDIRGCIKCQN